MASRIRHIGITFSNRVHKTLRIGSTLSLYRINNASVDGEIFTGTVARIDASDLVLLAINPEIQIPQITFAIPEQGCEYYLLGLSSINREFFVNSGIVGGTGVSRHGHFFGNLVRPLGTLEVFASIKETHIIFWE